MIVNFLLFLLYMTRALSASNDVLSQLKSDDIDGIAYGASLQDLVIRLSKEMKATKKEMQQVKDDVKQIVSIPLDVVEIERNIGDNKKAIDGLWTGIKDLRTNMKSTYQSLRDSLKGELDGIRNSIEKNMRDISQMFKGGAGGSDDAKALRKEFLVEKASVAARFDSLTNDVKTLQTSFNSIKSYTLSIDDLKDEVKQNTQDISTNKNNMQHLILVNVANIASLQKETNDVKGSLTSVSTRLTSVSGDLTSLTKSYDDIKTDVRNLANLKDDIIKNTKAITINTNQLQIQISENDADIEGLKKDILNSKASATKSLTAMGGSITSLTKSYNNLKVEIKSGGNLKELKAEVEKNRKVISSSTNTLQIEITKNSAALKALTSSFGDEQATTAKRFGTIDGSITSLTQLVQSSKGGAKDYGDLKVEIVKNQKTISANTNKLQGQITKNIADIKALTSSFGTEKASVTKKIGSLVSSFTSVSKLHAALQQSYTKDIGYLKATVINNQKSISSNVKTLQSGINKNARTIAALTSSFGTEKASVTKKIGSLGSSITSVSKLHSALQKSYTKDIGYLKATVISNQKSISSNVKTLQSGINKNAGTIAGVRKDLTALSATLASQVKGLSGSWKAWYTNIQNILKNNIDGVKASISSTQKSITATSNKLQGQITKNAVGIRNVGVQVTKLSGSVSSNAKRILTLSTSQTSIQKALQKDIAGVRGSVAGNTRAINANMNTIQARINKNAADILGLKNSLGKQVSSVSSHVTSVVKDLTTKITSFTTSTKQINDRIRKEEIGLSQMATYTEGIKKALQSTAMIVFYPQKTTKAFGYDVYREFNAHFFAYGWPLKYDKAHNLGNVPLKKCIKDCHQMKRRDSRWKAVAYYSEGSHCWCYRNPQRNIQPHTTVVTYMLM